jgi:hypothetical protein
VVQVVVECVESVVFALVLSGRFRGSEVMPNLRRYMQGVGGELCALDWRDEIACGLADWIGLGRGCVGAGWGGFLREAADDV